jgi:hypothetical protein
MTSIIKVDNLQNQCGANIISESANVITIGASGDTVTLAAGASQSGFGRSGSVNWDTTKKTTGFTAVSGNGYFCDTTSAAFTVTLPAGPSAGDIVAIADYNGTAGTNNITIGRNSSNINGSAADFKISINYASISFVYVDATAGWRSVDTSDTISVQNQFVSATGGTITTSGNFKIHTFTGPGTFTVNTTGPGSSTVDYLVVAGGGGGGGNPGNGGGGGAGGFRTNFPSSCAGIPVTAQAYPITVGAGGAIQTNGNNSVFSTITSTAGGTGGLGNCASVPGRTGSAGGSGGGGGGGGPSPGAVGPGGTGNSPPTSPSQGNNGGTGGPSITSGGGGGAGAVGGNANGTVGGNGGNGTANSITGSSVTYSGGGGGGIWNGVNGPGGTGGSGGGGNGPISPAPASGVAGTPNTGGGGGGGGTSGSGATGGSGIVVIRYKFQ